MLVGPVRQGYLRQTGHSIFVRFVIRIRAKNVMHRHRLLGGHFWPRIRCELAPLWKKKSPLRPQFFEENMFYREKPGVLRVPPPRLYPLHKQRPARINQGAGDGSYDWLRQKSSQRNAGKVDFPFGVVFGNGSVGGDLDNPSGIISPGNGPGSLLAVPEPTAWGILICGLWSVVSCRIRIMAA